MTDERGEDYLIEDRAEGRTLIVTGAWSAAARAAVERSDVDGVWLNYARGYAEPDLSFLEAWPIRRLLVLDRSITDLTPLARLGETLEDLSLQAAPGISIDLASLPQLRRLGAYWDVIKDTLYAPEYLSDLVTFDYGEVDLDALTVRPSLQRIQLKVARNLETLDGAEHFSTLTSLKIAAARKLHGLGALRTVAATLRELAFEDCPEINELEILGELRELRFLEIGDCGPIPSVRPIGELSRLEVLYAWGTTRVENGDLAPLLGLASLKEIRMRDRRQYKPTVEAVKEQLGCA